MEETLFNISAYAGRDYDEKELQNKLKINTKNLKKNIKVLKDSGILKEFI